MGSDSPQWKSSNKKESPMADFATIVRNARLEMGLTLQQLADKIGTEKGYCSGV